MKLAKVEKELEGEKASSIALAASLKMAEDMALKHKDSYVRERLESIQSDYAELHGHLVGSVTSVYENLKDQVRVLAPELDLSLFNLDNIMEMGRSSLPRMKMMMM